MGKFSSILDIPFDKFRRMLRESELDVMAHLAKLKKNKNEKVEQKKPEKSSKVHAQIQKMKAKYLKKVKEDNEVAAKVELPKQSTTAQKTEKSGKSDQEMTKRFLSTKDLPAELMEIVNSHLNINDFAKLADVAESERSLEVASYARSEFIMR